MSAVEVKFVRSSSATSVNIDGEEVVLESEGGNYFSLNVVAADIWHMLEQPKTFDELVHEILDTYDVDPGECRDDLSALVEQMQAARIVIKAPAT